MIGTLINVVVATGLSVASYYITNLWQFILVGWIVGLLSLLTAISLVINGTVMLSKKRWLLGAINLVMLIPLLYFLTSTATMVL